MQKITDFFEKNFDVIIIGAGGAGLMSAISSINNNIKNIAVISKVFPTLSHTGAAKGGINAALGNREKDDWKWHAYDTIKAGDFLTDKKAVEYMCRQAPEAIINLEKMGVAFSRFENGTIYQRAYGGQKTEFGKGKIAYRSCSSQDKTGHTILHSLYQQCLNKGVKFFNDFFVTDLLIDDKSKCHGAVAIDLNEGKVNVFKSQITIIASGGYSQIYKNATSSNICSGDGSAMLLKAGLQLQDMEFIQFHPTSLYGSNLLVTEAARGEGGYLINSKGEKFMENYSPEFGDLAPRDVIARSMSNEIYQGRGCGPDKDYLKLIISHLPEEIIKEKLPGLVEIAKSFAGIDVMKDPIPVTPVAHYTMGGIPTDINCQVINFDGKKKKTIKGLLAIGEAACISVHGANRLGCNSLLDIIVFGELSGKTAAKLLNEDNRQKFSTEIINQKLKKIDEILNQQGEENICKIKSDLQEINWQYAGIFRNKTLLEEGLSKLKILYKRLSFVTVKNKSFLWNNELIEYLETENLLLQSIATVKSALLRNESRGAHYREDFPKKDDKNWLCHSLISFDKEKLDEKELVVDFGIRKSNL